MRRSVQSTLFVVVVAGLASLASLGCDKLKPGGGEARGSQPISSITAGTASAPPVPTPPASASAGIDPNASELEQAKAYSKGGQLWLARLVLEQKALGDSGTRDEASYLADLCQEQGDQACLDACGKKLGKKLVLAKAGPERKDAGVAALPSAEAEDNSDFGKARALMLKGQNAKARAILEPRVLENKASREEVRLLLEVCRVQKDKMCMALCQSRIGG